MAKTMAVVDQTSSRMEPLKRGPERLGEFLKDVRAEMKKVITPTRAEVQATTIVVIATVFLFAAFFAVVDTAAARFIEFLFNHLAKS